MDAKTLINLKKLAKSYREKGNDFSKYLELAQARLGEAVSYYDISDAYYAYTEAERLEVNKKKQKHVRISGDDYIVATQFFTPSAICEYLAANAVKSVCDVELSDAAYLDCNTKKGKLSVGNIAILDPAVGTGNLLYAATCELLTALAEQGIAEDEAKSIVARSICGIDLDGKVAGFAKERLESLLGQEVQILAIPAVNEKLLQKLKVKASEGLYKKLSCLNLSGSLEKFTSSDVEELRNLSCEKRFGGSLEKITEVAEALAKKYDIVLMNPPYLSSSDYGEDLDKWVSERYPEYRADLFSIFTVRALDFLRCGGMLGLVAPYNWMFLRQFEGLRRHIIECHSVSNLAKFPSEGYLRAMVYLSASVIKCQAPDESGSFIDITNPKRAEVDLATACRKKIAEGKYIVKVADFRAYPGAVYAFWLGKAGENFGKTSLSEVLEIRQGLATGNNKKFLKLLKDVNPQDVDFISESMEEFIAGGKRYALYSKGGKFRKWFGNRTYVIDFSAEAREKLAKAGNHMPSKTFYFHRGITWTLVSSKGVFGARLAESSVFDVGGSCGFPKNPDDLYAILAYLCSKVATYYLSALNPTVNTQVGDIKNLPYLEPPKAVKEELTTLAKKCVAIARADWEDAPQEIAFAEAAERRLVMRQSEERINELMITLYGLEEKLSPGVDDKLITLLHV